MSEPGTRRRGKAWLGWLAGGCLVVLGIAFGVGSYYARHAEPLVKASLVQLLRERFHARVELDEFHLSVGAGVVAEADGLRIWLPEVGMAGRGGVASAGEASAAPWLGKPWITVRSLRFAASMSFLHGGPVRVSTIHVDGVRILVPPKAYRPEIGGRAGNGGKQPSRLEGFFLAAGKNAGWKAPAMVVERIECRDVFLEMERDSAEDNSEAIQGKPSAGVRGTVGRPAGSAAGVAVTGERQAAAEEPLQFEISSLELTPEEHGGPMHFVLRMTNPRPTGTIEASGELGPWNLAGAGGTFDPGGLPLRGEYRFEHADLSTIQGIAGRLSSAGQLYGTLRQVKVDGETATPDFRLTRKGVVPPATVGVPLWTRFQATVDGTNGNTVLDQVEAKLGSTHLWARGEILRVVDSGAAAGAIEKLPDHDLRLQITVDHGRIEDFLRVVTENETPLVTGAMTLTNSLHLPPGRESVRERLELAGSFHATGARFSNAKVEDEIAQLSLRGQGHPEALHGPGSAAESASIVSAMSGRFALKSGVLSLPDLDYQVPGADVHVHGTYTLEGGALEFAGDARMKASLSAMVGGWKGFLLKPMNRMLSKNGAGTDIPIHLTGTRAEPKFGVDFDRMGKPDAGGAGGQQP